MHASDRYRSAGLIKMVWAAGLWALISGPASAAPPSAHKAAAAHAGAHAPLHGSTHAATHSAKVPATAVDALPAASAATPTVPLVQDVPAPADLSPELAKKYLTAASRFYQVGDVKLHVRDEGKGAVIVLLHDAMSSLQAWDPWMKELVGSYRVIRVDEPGNGLSGSYPAGDYTPERVLATLTRLIEGLGLQHITLVGNGMGGFYAARFAAEHPDQVERLALLAPAAYPAKLPPMLTYYLHNNEGEDMPAPVPMNLYAPSFRQSYGEPSRIQPGVMERYQELTQLPGNRRANLQLLRVLRDFGKNPDDYASKQPAFVKQLKMPVLIMWGQRDRMISSDQAQLWKRDVPQAQVILYPDAGHPLSEEIPEQSLKDFLAFMRGDTPGATVSASSRP
jgi:pimeloyl-ACP methyl ester carboxylesterase